MSDEAVVRIIIQDNTGTSSGSPAPPSSSPPPTSPTGTQPTPPPSSRSHPAPSPSPPPAGSTSRTGQQSGGSQPPQPYSHYPSPATTTSTARPSWVNELIDGITKSVKQLATQLSGGRLTPSTTTSTTTGIGGSPQILQPLQQLVQTSIPPINTSIVPPAGQGPSYSYQPPPPPLPPSYSVPAQPTPPAGTVAATSLLSSGSTVTAPPTTRRYQAGSVEAKERAKLAAETRRRNREAELAEINQARMERAGGLDAPGAKFETAEEETARKKRDRRRERDRLRRQAKRQATVAAAVGAAPATADTLPPINATDSAGESADQELADASPEVESPEPPPTKAKPTRDLSWPGGSTLAKGGQLPRFADGGELLDVNDPAVRRRLFGIKEDYSKEYFERAKYAEFKDNEATRRVYWENIERRNQKMHGLPKMAGGGELPRYAGGFFSNLFGAGQKGKQPAFDAATWMANNKAIDALRDALGQAGYTAKDVSRLASNKDILDMWKAGWTVANLRTSGLIPYDPYKPGDIEVVSDKPPEPVIPEPSIPQAPPPPIPGVRVNKRGEIILARKRKKRFFPEGGELPRMSGGGETSERAEVYTAEYLERAKYAALADNDATRRLYWETIERRNQKIYEEEEAKRLAEIREKAKRFGYIDDEGRPIPRMADGGQVEVPVGKAVAPQLLPHERDLLGLAAYTEFTDPYFNLSNNKLLEIYRQNKPLPLPPGPDVKDLPPQFLKDWSDISRLMPGSAKAIVGMGLLRGRKKDEASGFYKPDKTRPIGVLGLDADSYSTETLAHELVHAEQHRRGDLNYKKEFNSRGELTSYGQLIESEAYQRGKQLVEVLTRLRSLKSSQAIPAQATGGPRAAMAIVGDLPGQSLESIKSDPHTEIIMGNQVIPHNEAVRHGLFDAKVPKYATGNFPKGFGPPPWQIPPKFTTKNVRPRLPKIPNNINRGLVNPNIDTNRTIISSIGQAADWSASAPNVGKDIEDFGGVVSNAGEALSKIHPVAGVLVSAFGEAGKAVGSFMQAVDKTVERYGEVSPAIAQQQAIGEIRQVMGDMRRARESGPELVRYMQTQQDMQQKFEDIKIKIMTQILKVVTPILEVIEKILPEGEEMTGAITALMAPLVTLANAATIVANVQRDDNRPYVQDPAQMLIDGVGNINNFGTLFRPNPDEDNWM